MILASVITIHKYKYFPVKTSIFFQNGETSKTVTLTILDDTEAEDDEVVFVYLIAKTDGVRVAQPNIDNGKYVGYIPSHFY